MSNEEYAMEVARLNQERENLLQFIQDKRNELSGHEHNDRVLKQLEADIDLFLLEQY